jgi:hypothetical protein
MEMKLSEFLSQRCSDETFRYVGTAWGSDPWEATGAEIAEMISGDPDYDADDTDHPAYGGQNGWYTESENIGLIAERGYQQIILERID